MKINNESLIGNNNSVYYNKTFYGFCPASKELFETMGFTLIGELPKEDREIIITKYLFDQINIGGINLYTDYDENSIPERYITTLLPDPSRSAQSFVEQELYINLENEYWKIVGVLDTKADKSGKFESLKPSEGRNAYLQLLRSECIDYFRYGYHSIAYISQDKYDEIVKSHSADLEGWDVFGAPAEGTINVAREGGNVGFWGIASDKDLDRVKEVIWLDGNERLTLQDNEYVIGLNAAISLLQEDFSIETRKYYTHGKTYFDGTTSIATMSFYELYSERNCATRYIACFEEAESISVEELKVFENFVLERINSMPYIQNETNDYYVLDLLYYPIYSSNIVVLSEDLVTDVTKLEEKHWRILYAGYLLKTTDWNTNISLDGTIYGERYNFKMSCGYNNNVTGRRTGEALEKIDAKLLYVQAKLASLQEQKVVKYNIYYKSDVFQNFNKPTEEDSTIVGIYVPQDDFPKGEHIDAFVFNNTMYRNVGNVEIASYSFLLAPMPKDRAQLQKLIDVHFENGDRVLKMHNGFVIQYNTIQEPLIKMRIILFCLGVGLAVFSIMTIGNYIGTSIYNKKREVGILRALGAKTSDVFAIFVNESIIIALLNAFTSILVTVIACIGMNSIIKNMTQVDLTVLNFGVRQVAIMIIINIAIAVFASLIPIYRLSKKKPIDCIQDR